MTTREFAKKYGVSIRRVQKLIKEGRIKASVNSFNGYYDIPEDEKYPRDNRQSNFTRRFYKDITRRPI